MYTASKERYHVMECSRSGNFRVKIGQQMKSGGV